MRPRWKHALLNALNSCTEPSAGFYSIATAHDGLPQVRTVVHRGFVNEGRSGRIDQREPESFALLFTTDARSPKSREIAENPHVQIAWYMEQARTQVSQYLQFRISGCAYLVNANTTNAPPLESLKWHNERKRVYMSLSQGMKASFSAPASGTEDMAAAVPEVDGIPERFAYTNSFSLVIVVPTAVDVLGLHTNVRTIHVCESGIWTMRHINP